MSTATLEMPETHLISPKLERIILTGFMGSGKTTVGKELAAISGWEFLDLDREIERRDGRSVPQIFAESGEAFFRKIEAATLASVLGKRRVIIALGGGAPEELGNRLLLEQTPRTAIIYLTAEFTELVARCRKEAEDPDAVARPVLADETVAITRFMRRKPHYERIADHIIQTGALTPSDCVDAVLAKLAK